VKRKKPFKHSWIGDKFADWGDNLVQDKELREGSLKAALLVVMLYFLAVFVVPIHILTRKPKGRSDAREPETP